MATRQLYIVVMIYCVIDYEKLHATALDAKNIALGKYASISSTYPDSGPAFLAVDGNTNTAYASVSSGRPNCIHTADNDHNAWWEVDLEHNYNITNITVYIRDGQPRRMDNVRITVDGKECYTFPSGTSSTSSAKSVSCTSTVQGSVVRLSRNTADFYLHFCEVQVWGDACSCSSGCNFTQSCIPAGNCQKENVALGKPASMSSSAYSTGPACVAVNGNIGTTYDISQQNLNCIHTSNGPNEWWEVYLGRNYTITDITVYIRYDQPGRMDNLRITVDGKECYNFPSGNTNVPEAKSISCNSPVQGSVVRLSRNTSDYFLTFCEVQVWVCRPGLYGKDCQSQCNCKNNTVCDNYHGSCAAGCSTGYYGSNCTQTCGRCKINSTCDSTSGYCLEGCQVGWKMPMCFEECSKGYYGNNCSQVCGICKDESTCISTNGQCLDGCKTGWKEPMCAVCRPGLYGKDCQSQCNCKNNTVCDNYHGSCAAGCSTGYYGSNCTQTCGRCKINSTCDSTSGYCLEGCQVGWKMPMCFEECSKGYYGNNCSQVCGICKDESTCNSTNGQCLDGCKTGWKEPMCAECKEGNYGAICNQTCGKCLNSMCNASNGVCPEGCQDGFELPFCNETCRNHTYGQNCSLQCGRCNKSAQCDAITGNCTSCEANFQLPKCVECIHGYYGEDCNIPCGHCKDGKMCNNTDGVCPDGCEDGYEFPLCNKKCSSGTWGKNCENACGACRWSTCRHDNGICEKGCFSGYEGEHCRVLLQQTNDRHLTGVIAGSVVGAGLLIGISILIAVLIWLRRSTLKDKRCPQPSVEDRETHDTSKDDIAMENSNFYENAYDKLDTQEDVAKPYEMLGKEIHVDDVMQSQH